MNEIITALEAKYHPLGMIVYGSYADGTNNLNSDFDALLLTDSGSELHDSSVISLNLMFGYIRELKSRPLTMPTNFCKFGTASLSPMKRGFFRACKRKSASTYTARQQRGGRKTFRISTGAGRCWREQNAETLKDDTADAGC